MKLRGGRAGRIEGDLVPLQHEQFVGGREAFGLDEVEVGVEVRDAAGDVDVEGVDVEEVALPGDLLAVSHEVQAGDGVQRAVGAVLAGDPLGVVEGERAGLHGDDFVDMENLLRGVGGVHGEGDVRLRECGQGEAEGEGRRKETSRHASAPRFGIGGHDSGL